MWLVGQVDFDGVALACSDLCAVFIVGKPFLVVGLHYIVEYFSVDCFAVLFEFL